ncbi:MAG: rhomboid family intramembrane serine protease [Leadbetterella sp.]
MDTITINSILIVAILITSLMAFNNSEFRSKLIHNPYRVHRNKEYFRLMGSGFIHADYMHLAFNMLALYSFGNYVESYFSSLFPSMGKTMYLLLFLSGVLVANIPDFLKYKEKPHFNSLGASGGVASIVFASIILSPLSKLIFFPIPIPLPAYVFAIVYMAYSIFMERRQMDNVNHMAHLWGSLWGALFIITVEPSSLLSFIEQIKSSF